MYEIEKQKELASICKAICSNLCKQNIYKESTEKLLKNADVEQKLKLENYVKILVLSTTDKDDMDLPYTDMSELINKELYTKLEYSLNDAMLVFLISGSLELMIYKSKELKNDIRLKLVQELYDIIEIKNRKLVFAIQKIITKIAGGK